MRPREDELIDAPLWCVRLPGNGLCVAETAEGGLLVLFTTRALADCFIQDEELRTTEQASSALYSHSRPEFLRRARTAAADGLRGLLINLRGDGQVEEIFGFDTLAVDPLTTGFAPRPPRRVVH